MLLERQQRTTERTDRRTTAFTLPDAASILVGVDTPK